MQTERLLQLLRIERPIIQAPMAGIQGSAMTIAVSNAGGLGSLPCAMLSAEQLRAELERIVAGTTKPYNVNFFCHTPTPFDAQREAQWRALLAPYYGELGVDQSSIVNGAGRVPFDQAASDLLAQFKPPVVSFHFGLPDPTLLAQVKSWGAVVLSSATTVQEAQWLEAHGADAIIAQGVEAGGHRGVFLLDGQDPCDAMGTQLSTFALVPQVVRAVKVPVIAAGGIADAQGVRAALALGASAAQVGTSYMLCDQATTSPMHRAALQAVPHQTALTNLFTGRPARGIVNRVMRELGAINRIAPAFAHSTAALAPLRAAAEKTGSGDFSPLWSGQNASGCKAICAGELTQQLWP